MCGQPLEVKQEKKLTAHAAQGVVSVGEGPWGRSLVGRSLGGRSHIGQEPQEGGDFLVFRSISILLLHCAALCL